MSKELISDYMEKIWNQKKIEEILQFFSPGAKIHSPLGDYQNASDMTEIVSKWLNAITEMKVTQLNMIQEGDLVVSHWEAKGTFKEDINDIKATQKPVSYQGITQFRIKDGKITEYWAFVDTSGLSN